MRSANHIVSAKNRALNNYPIEGVREEDGCRDVPQLINVTKPRFPKCPKKRFYSFFCFG